MNCILHIGLEKTGTTSIQWFLSDHRDQLIGDGFLHPRLTGHGGHAPLCVASYDHFRDDDLCRYAHVSNENDWREYPDSLRETLCAEMEEGARIGANTLIISSEHIQSRLRSTTELNRLRSILHEVGVKSIDVLVYLRDPVEIAASLYSTAVKFGSKSLAPPSPDHEYYRNVCDHRATILRFCEVFGTSSVRPRLFEKPSFPKGSILLDFCEMAGIPHWKYTISMDAANRSLSEIGIAILARLNEVVPVFLHGHYNPDRQKLIAHLESRFSSPPYRPSMETVSAYRNAFSESNEWVRARYFTDRKVLFAAPSPSSPTQAESLSAEELDRLAGQVHAEILNPR